jgi:hypothetical protein
MGPGQRRKGNRCAALDRCRSLTGTVTRVRQTLNENSGVNRQRQQQNVNW